MNTNGAKGLNEAEETNNNQLQKEKCTNIQVLYRFKTNACSQFVDANNLINNECK